MTKIELTKEEFFDLVEWDDEIVDRWKVVGDEYGNNYHYFVIKQDGKYFMTSVLHNQNNGYDVYHNVTFDEVIPEEVTKTEWRIVLDS